MHTCIVKQRKTVQFLYKLRVLYFFLPVSDSLSLINIIPLLKEGVSNTLHIT
jgi:hypothetical protein